MKWQSQNSEPGSLVAESRAFNPYAMLLLRRLVLSHRERKMKYYTYKVPCCGAQKVELNYCEGISPVSLKDIKTSSARYRTTFMGCLFFGGAAYGILVP